MSAWSAAPDRGLDKVVQIDAPLSPFEPQPTFAPELLSDPLKREKVSSSGYGVSPVALKPKTERVGGLSVDEAVPEFKPELVGNADLRAKVKSSDYGKAVPAKKTVEPEAPSFSPEIVTKTKPVSQAWSEKASSSAYGRMSVTSRPATAATPPSFKPELPVDKLRETIASSQYGKVSPAKVERPQSANGTANGHEGFDNNSGLPVTYVSRYTLLKDKPDAEKERASSPTFVLDGVHVSALRLAGVRNSDTDLGARKLPNFDLSRQIKEKVTSSNYGVASPPIIPRPESASKDSPGRFKFDQSVSVMEQPVEQGPKVTALAAKVASHGYGVATPERGPKPEPKAAEPTWHNTLKSALPVELPPAPKNELNKSVKSHDYGKASPAKSERVDKPFEPVWVPSSSGHKLAKDLPPAPKNKLNDSVASHYGKDYRPPTAAGSTIGSHATSPMPNGHRGNGRAASAKNSGNGNTHSANNSAVNGEEHEEEHEEEHHEEDGHAGAETF